MKLLPSFRLAAASAWCAALIGCAGSGDSGPPTVVRTPPPKGYEKTITNYLAFRIRNPQKNTEINVGQPEPGPCPLDGYLASARGWVVPVVYATRKGEVTGRETIYITTKQYYFWFLGDTIAGITPRIELCPGIEAAFSDGAAPGAAAGGFLTTTFPAATAADAQRRDSADTSQSADPRRAQVRVKATSGQKQGTATKAKKKGSSSHGHPVKKTASVRAPVATEAKP